MNFKFPRFRKVVRSFHKYKPSNGEAKFLLFGPKSSGKTSMIKTLMNENNPQFKTLETISETEKYESYEFNENVKIFDIWGWKTEDNVPNISISSFKSILRGRLKIGAFSDYKFDLNSSIRNFENMIDGVIFLGVDDPDFSNYYDKYVEAAREQNIMTFIAVSKCDEMVYNIFECWGPEDLYSSVEWKNYEKGVIEKLDDPYYPIFPFWSYTDSLEFKRPDIRVQKFGEEFVKMIVEFLEKKWEEEKGKMVEENKGKDDIDRLDFIISSYEEEIGNHISPFKITFTWNMSSIKVFSKFLFWM